MIKYKYYKMKVKCEIDKAKATWVTKLKQSKQGIWKAAKSSHSHASSDTLRLLSTFSSPKNIANALNSTFASVFRPRSSPVELTKMHADNHVWNINVTPEVVEGLITKLKSGKSAGIDNLTPRLLKASCGLLTGPITHLFCLSIEVCEVPTQWKRALVVPLPKKKNPDLSDFRPISLLPIVSKLLEDLVLKSVKQDLIKIYGPNQFGFRPGSSTLHAQIYIQDFVTRELDTNPTCCVALLAFDLSKAFDRLSHGCLLHTLLNSDLPLNFIRWIKSFLEDRRQRVLFQSAHSDDEARVTSGVPQGSILAPYLFAAHIGALMPHSTQSHMLKYADDIMILFRFKSSDELSSRSQSEQKNIEHWCEANGLSLNKDKTRLLIFPKNRLISLPDNFNMNVCDALKVLATVFQSDLLWDKHVNLLTSSASRRLHILRHLKRTPCVSKTDLIPIYYSLILSVLEYTRPYLSGSIRRMHLNLKK